MSLLERPQAQALWADAVVTPAAVRGCQEHRTDFLRRSLPLCYRPEQRDLATLVLQGRLSGLERKTSEPIAHQAGRHRKPVQHFVGQGAWDDEAVMAELRRHVAEELGDPDAVLVLDSSGFPKKGTESCGVARQGCGRLGKIDNCQVGVFLSYAAQGGHAPLDRRLFLPPQWAADGKRRRPTHVPQDSVFQQKWRIGLDLRDRSGPDVPHAWVVGDDAFGRAADFRAAPSVKPIWSSASCHISSRHSAHAGGAAFPRRRPGHEAVVRRAASGRGGLGASPGSQCRSPGLPPEWGPWGVLRGFRPIRAWLLGCAVPAPCRFPASRPCPAAVCTAH